MRPIPEQIQALLKSKTMIGPNKPQYKIVVEGQPGATGLKDPENWTVLREFVDKGFGNICETIDGRAIAAYVEGDAVKVAFAPTVRGILEGTETFDYASAITVKSSESTAHFQVSVNLIDGQLYMAISQESPKPVKAEFWRDSNGRGEDFGKVSDITTDNGSNPTDRDRYCPVTTIHKLGNGNLALCVPLLVNDEMRNSVRAHYSTNNGESWTAGATFTQPIGSHFSGNFSKTLHVMGSDAFFGYWLASSLRNRIQYFTNSGASCATHTMDYIAWTGALVTIGESAYMVKIDGDWKFKAYILNEEHDIDNIDSYTEILNFTFLKELTPGLNYYDVGLLLTRGELIAFTSESSRIRGAGVEVEEGEELRAKLISISKNDRMASSLDVEVDNKDGIYSPDNAESDWTQVLWPNKQIYVEQGYGQNLIKTFTGLIDSVSMTTFPHSLTISARDRYKKALDQLITDGDGNHVVTLSGPVEDAVTALAGMCGLAIGEAGTTGVSMEKTFAYESYADAFQYYCDLCNFEALCDEEGLFYFRENSMPSAEPDWIYREGEDIFSLGYDINDSELYSYVIVIGKSGEGEEAEAIVFEKAVPIAQYGMSEQKKLVIQATEATTEGECETIADRAIAAIITRARVVEFAAVGNPWAQVGDVLQVIEKSTTISEVYRVKDMGIRQQADGTFISTFRAYWYSHPTGE